MTAPAPNVETMKFTETRQQLSQVVNRVFRRESRVLIEKNGVPVAAIVSADDLRRLGNLDARHDDYAAELREISRAFADVPVDDLEHQVARVIAENRAAAELARVAGPEATDTTG